MMPLKAMYSPAHREFSSEAAFFEDLQSRSGNGSPAAKISMPTRRLNGVKRVKNKPWGYSKA